MTDLVAAAFIIQRPAAGAEMSGRQRRTADGRPDFGLWCVLVGRLVGRLVGQLVGRLVGRWVDRSTVCGRLTSAPFQPGRRSARSARRPGPRVISRRVAGEPSRRPLPENIARRNPSESKSNWPHYLLCDRTLVKCS